MLIYDDLLHAPVSITLGLIEQYLPAYIVNSSISYNDALTFCQNIYGTNPRHFQACVHELYVYSTLVKMGYDVKINPRVPNPNTEKGDLTPDFKATDTTGEIFYVEAKFINANNAKEEEFDQFYKLVCNINKQLENSKHIGGLTVHYELNGKWPAEPSANNIATAINNWLDEPNKKDINELNVEIGNLIISINECSTERKEKIRITAYGMYVAHLHNGIQKIKGAIRKKSKKYNFKYPLIICVAAKYHGFDTDIEPALYGSVVTNNGVSARNHDGIFNGANGPSKSVSAVWFMPLNIDYRPKGDIMYFNMPNNNKSLPKSVDRFNPVKYDETTDRLNNDNGQMVFVSDSIKTQSYYYFR